MRFPWSKREPERREALPFTDAVVAALTAQAAGTVAGDPSAIAALETAAGLWARAFASAEVAPATPATAAVTPACLALIARDLIRRGESVHAIEVERGAIRLAPVGSWDVRGGPDERAWWYRCDVFGPSGNLTRFVPSGAVVHARYAVDASRPWYGISPLGWARATGALAANLETRLGEEAGGPVGHLLPVPQDGGDGEAADPLAGLKVDLAKGRGRTMLVETTAAGFGEGRMAAPAEDWKPRRFGASPPEALGTLREGASLAVLAACGVPPTLGSGRGDASALREAWRQFLHGTIQPVAAMVATELGRKLDVPGLSLSFDRLFASDLSGRARAFQSMVGAGMDPAKAAGLAGLMDSG